MRRFASWMSASIRLVPSSPSEPRPSRAEAASCDATPPACAPPIPSATAKSGGATKEVSSFRRRLRPVSLATAYAPTGISVLLHHEVGLADAQDVARLEALRAGDARAVDERAVRRLQIQHPGAVAAHLDPRVAGRCELVAGEHEVVLPTPTDRDGRRVERELCSVFEARAALHDEPDRPARPLPTTEPGCRGGCGCEDHAVLARRLPLASRQADDAHDEEVEQHEEGDLEDEEYLRDPRRGDHGHRAPYSRSVEKVTVVSPIVKREPSASRTRWTRRPSTSVPFVEPRSTSQYVEPSWTISAWRRETFGSSIRTSTSRERPSTERCCSRTRRWPLQLSTATSRSTPRSASDAASVGWVRGL